MPVPSPRNKILPARGNFSDLSVNVASLLDGEICYAIDQDQYYQNEGGTLVSVGATKAQGLLADSAVQPGDNVSDLTNDANYITLAEVPGDLVTSVNTQTGDVVLDADDIDDSATTNKFATAAQLGLADTSVQPGDNISDLTNDANYIDAAGAPVQSVNTQTGDVVLGASDVGLGNVDNTSDADKPVSTATQTALDAKADLVDGHIPTSQIPAIAITEFLGSVASETAMLALVGQPGDWCLRTDKAVGYVITGADPSDIANWEAFTVPGSAVTSINTQVGDVVLGASDVGAATAAQGSKADSAVQPTDSIDILADVDISTTAPTDGQALIWDNAGGKFVPGEAGLVDSVNTQTGDVVLDADDIDDTFTTHKFVTAEQVSKIDNAASTQGSISQFVDLEISSTPSDGDALVYSGIAFVPTAITSSQWDNVTGGINYADGNVGIGTTSPPSALSVVSTNTNTQETVAEFGNQTIAGGLEIETNGNSDWGFNAKDTRNLTFSTNQNEAARIDSSGRVLVGMSGPVFTPATSGFAKLQVASTGTSAGATNSRFSNNAAAPFYEFAKSRGTSVGAQAVVGENDQLGTILFAGSDGSAFVEGARIRAQVDGTPGTNDMPGRLVFSTSADGSSSPTERMRLTSNGALIIGNSQTSSVPSNEKFYADNVVSGFNRISDGKVVRYYSNATEVGSVSVNSSSTSYNTSSDYRLKENVVDLTGAIDRVNQLQVRRFNFIADPDTTVDGFLAHEAQAVVPEAVHGTKDEVDGKGNPVYQGIDQSKLVPLLTAALQEALAKIETLEQRLTDAGL